MTAKADKFTLFYTLLFAALFLLFVYSHDLDRVFGLWLLLVPILLIPSFALTVFWLIDLVRNIIRRSWRRVASIVVAPFLAYAIFAALAAAGVNPDSIRFAVGKSVYLDQIERLPKNGELRVAVFDWGNTGGAAAPQIFHTLIYDESDEIALPADQRSASWRSRTNRLCPGTQMCLILDPPEIANSIEVRKMDDHFYLITTVW